MHIANVNVLLIVLQPFQQGADSEGSDLNTVKNGKVVDM